MRTARGSAMQQFMEGLQNGDPAAYGLLGLVVVLALIAGGIWIADQRAKKAEAAKKSGKRPR
jgi:hypothetical protein